MTKYVVYQDFGNIQRFEEEGLSHEIRSDGALVITGPRDANANVQFVVWFSRDSWNWFQRTNQGEVNHGIR